MTPLTRKENYLNEIVGWGETAPEKPLTPEEFFFAAILGEAVQTPEPLSRYQIYLAKIAGRNISVPKPLTRLELFLAKACGMDIETPTPITREEIFWSNYSAIVDFEVEGILPLSFKAKAGALKDYRIYGNTVDGESVGDLETTGEHAGKYKVPVTVEGKNLAYITKFTNNNTQVTAQGITFSIIDNEVHANGTANGTYPQVIGNDYVLTDWETYAATLYIDGNYTGKPYIFCTTTYNSAGNYKLIKPNTRTVFTALPNTKLLFVTEGNGKSFNITYKLLITKASIEDSTYEPYHAPVTTPIYLPEQIRKVGDEAEYIDYSEQKLHRIGAEDIDVTLPALPTLTGTNVLSVGTAVQPSKVYVKYKGERQ